MATSSDETIKREIIDFIGSKIGNIEVRVFPDGSNQDQISFEKGGLTFCVDGVNYGSCDVVYLTVDNDKLNVAILAIEGTDALNRKSSGNAQYQRFHHALGAVKNGIIGVYYLKKGREKIRNDLYAMAYHATLLESGVYLIVQDLNVIKHIIELYLFDQKNLKTYLKDYSENSYKIFLNEFNLKYKGSWDLFAEKRSTIVFKKYIVKHSARMLRNFTDSSQRAGHIAVGEMYLSKYFFSPKHLYYLWPRMTEKDLNYLDVNKSEDKEWYLLRNEPNVTIITIDNISNVPTNIRKKLKLLSQVPLKGIYLKQYKSCVKYIIEKLKNGEMKLINV